MTAIEKLISRAKQENGYLEKKSNKDLDSKTGNAGSNNYTKYARDLYPSLQGQAWCDLQGGTSSGQKGKNYFDSDTEFFT